MGDLSFLVSMSNVFNKLKPYLAMVALQFGYAGMYIITLVSLKRGFSHWILVVYRHAVATLVFAPFAYFLEKKIRPKMTKSVFLKIAVLAFLELETVNLKRISSIAKVVGTSITLTGAMLMTLYKGPVVNILWYSHAGTHHKAAARGRRHRPALGHRHNHVDFLYCGLVCLLHLAKQDVEGVPAELSLASLICLMGFVEGGIVGVIMEHRKSAWAIGFDSRLLAAAYSGIVCSGIAYYMQSIVNKSRGPVFVTAFSPLSMIITAVLGAIVLAEQVHLGSLIGAVIIVFGLYSVVWGKSKESASNKLADGEGRGQELPVVDKQTSGADAGHTAAKSKKSLEQAEP
ncbi:UNVERIFIED_CONTAM: WAT1-related protein [Sesamum latifolium]|uniref:WAT1-related protein n=1 Tax=Sesamum latifolium TaxID=2727402 RepID=A0AAW2WDV3_9LAMI